MTRRTAAIITVRRFDPESPHQLRDYFVHDAPIMPSTVVIRRSVFEDVGFFDESLRIGEDTEFYLRVAEKWRFCHVPGAYTFKRRHISQLSWRLDALLPSAALVTQRFSSHHPELRSLAGRRMARLHAKVSADCAMKGERRKALRHNSHGDPPRAALLACLGQPGAFARTSVRRAALLRGPQETLARRATVMALRLTVAREKTVCAFSTW